MPIAKTARFDTYLICIRKLVCLALDCVTCVRIGLGDQAFQLGDKDIVCLRNYRRGIHGDVNSRCWLCSDTSET